LSGGNQQKVAVAKWLCTRAKLYVFHEPTRGVDVATKAEIHVLIDRLAAQGAAVLVVSSDLPELTGLSDRIYVFRGGAVVGELSKREISQERVLAMATDDGVAHVVN
jgi:ribose transport system ATP-binding protein